MAKNNAKFYLIVSVVDFQQWKQNNPDDWNNYKPAFLAGFDITGARFSTNGNYAILENQQSWWNVNKFDIFHNLINGVQWIGLFPRYEPIPNFYLQYGYDKTIYQQLLENPNLWGLNE